MSGSDVAEPEGDQVVSVQCMALLHKRIAASDLPWDITAFSALSICQLSQSNYKTYEHGVQPVEWKTL